MTKSTKAEQISDTVEFRHQHITQPTLTSNDRVLHGMQNLTGALKDAPTVACDTQLQAIEELRNILRNWSGQKDISRAQQPSNIPHALLPIGGPLQVLFRESFFNVCLTRFLELKFIIF